MWVHDERNVLIEETERSTRSGSLGCNLYHRQQATLNTVDVTDLREYVYQFRQNSSRNELSVLNVK